MTRPRRWKRSVVLEWLVWLGRHERMTLIGLVCVAASIWGFVELADEVMEGETVSLDRTILLSMRTAGDPTDPLGPHWLEELMRDFTALGGAGVVTLVTLAAAGYLALQGKLRAALFVLSAVAGGLMMSLVLKQVFDRPRPDLVPHGAHVYTASFPSGHSMMSAVAYLTLGALLARVQRRWTMKAYFLLLAMALTLVVGISRIYLGVHWPTDVLAGWMVGAAWALLCWTVALRLQRRGRVEGSTAEGYRAAE